MFRKNKLLTLLIILIGLIGIYLLVDYTSSEDRTFRSKVTSFNADEITALRIKNPENGTDLEIKMEGEFLNIYEDGKLYSGDPRALAKILELLNGMSTESIIANKKEKWAEYKVDDAQAIVVDLYAGEDHVETIYVGKFGFKQIPSQNPQQQEQTKMSTARLAYGSLQVAAAVDPGECASSFGSTTPTSAVPEIAAPGDWPDCRQCRCGSMAKA